MDVRTESGDVVGYCSDVEFKPRSGIVQAFYVTAGAARVFWLVTRRCRRRCCAATRTARWSSRTRSSRSGIRAVPAAKAAEASVVVGDKVKKGAKVLDDKDRLPWTRAVAHWASSSARRAVCSRPLRTNIKRRAEARQKLQNSDVPIDGRQAGDLLLRLAVFMGEGTCAENDLT